jgi:hypothetical protein
LVWREQRRRLVARPRQRHLLRRHDWREIIAAGSATISATYLHPTGKRAGCDVD